MDNNIHRDSPMDNNSNMDNLMVNSYNNKCTNRVIYNNLMDNNSNHTTNNNNNPMGNSRLLDNHNIINSLMVNKMDINSQHINNNLNNNKKEIIINKWKLDKVVGSLELVKHLLHIDVSIVQNISLQ